MIRPISSKISPNFTATGNKKRLPAQRMAKHDISKILGENVSVSDKKFGLTIGLIFATLLAGVIAAGYFVTCSSKNTAQQTNPTVENVNK